MSYTLIHPFANLSHLPLRLLQEEGGKGKNFIHGRGAFILFLLPLSPGAELQAGDEAE